MITAIAYHSTDAFESDYLDQLVAEAADLAAQRQWWRDPFALGADPDQPDQLAGSSRLMRRYLEQPSGPPRKVDYRHDILMASADYLSILECLTLLSKEHEIEWVLSLPADKRPKPVGRILDGEIEPVLFDLIMPELDALSISERELADESLHQKLRDTYASPQRPS